MMSIFRVMLPFRVTLWGDMFSNVDRMANIDCPVFIIHGTRDEIVPFQHGQVCVCVFVCVCVV
jgi:abhydrolase domain-containing protein 17